MSFWPLCVWDDITQNFHFFHLTFPSLLLLSWFSSTVFFSFLLLLILLVAIVLHSELHVTSFRVEGIHQNKILPRTPCSLSCLFQTAVSTKATYCFDWMAPCYSQLRNSRSLRAGTVEYRNDGCLQMTR